MRVDYEARFHASLRRIAAYLSPEQLQRRAEKEYGLTYEESLEMAYENVLGEAKAALSGYRRKKPVDKAEGSEVRKGQDSSQS